ncbi:hypothetical protein AGR8A_Cc40385 [Agrobacterium fabrum str. J-07]|nr:hypothetical protein AGR8A_Cc40385 [Agrobacterium fabrum str. J-07]
MGARGVCFVFLETFHEREMARVTGLEPATSGVTGRHSNRLSYTRAPQTFVCVFSEEQDGASDGARTRDLRRDRPAL